MDPGGQKASTGGETSRRFQAQAQSPGQDGCPTDSAPGGVRDPPHTGNTDAPLDACGTVSTSSEETFDKRKATGASLAGHMYEVKMLALLYLRLGNSDTIDEFRLATNLKGLIPLDDVVLSYTTIAEPNRTKTIFIQLKHRIKKKIDAHMFKSAYGDFYLQGYLVAFNRIKEMFTTDVNERPALFRGRFENCVFLIYTPAPEGERFGRVSRKNNTNEVDVLLKTGSETDVERKEKIFKFNKQIDEEIFSQLSANETGEEFLKMLRVFAGQALEGDLDAMIKMELTKRLDKTPPEIDLILRSYLETFRYWWSESNVILNRNSNILNQCVDECEMSKLSLVHENMRGIKFKSISLFDVNALDQDTFLHIVTSRCSAPLSGIKLVQSLRDVKGGYIVLSLDALLRETETVLSAWNSGSKDRLLIVSGSTGKHEDVCNTVHKHLQLNLRSNKKKLIIVSVQDDPFVSTLKQTLLLNNVMCKEISDTFHFAQFETECKERILKRKILFQGESTTLGEILVEEADVATDVVDYELIRRALLPNISMTIGTCLEKDVTYYVPRTLERHDVLNENVLRKETKDVFIVRGITKQELKVKIPSSEKVGDVRADDKCRFLVVESDDDVRYIDKVLARKENVHEVRMCADGCLRWIATKGTDELMKKFINHDRPTPYYPDTALDLDARVILLIAEPGMGKSTFVTHLATETKASYPSFSVIRVNLGQHKKLLDNMCDDAAGFLSAALEIDQSEATLFRFVMETTGKCVVFLDGFDEIAPKYTGKGLSLIRSVLMTKVREVYITSRHAMKETLEIKFSTRAFTLKKFNEDDQKMFFEKFWTRDGNSTVTDQTRRLIKHVVRLIAHSLNDAAKEFMGIPLQTMMLAEIYEDHYKQNATVAELPEKLNILTMFEKFIDKKFEIYLTRRFPDVEDIESEIKKLSKSVYKEHMFASLEFLLGKIKINSLHKGKKIVEKNKIFYDEINIGDNKTGIIIEVLNYTPVFLHRTFAEYFAARWFSMNCNENRDFLRDNLFSVEFNFIRRQFNLMLAKKSKLLTAVVNNDIQSVRSLLTSSGNDSDVKVKDLGGRTVLHLAAVLDTGFRYEDPDYKLIGPPPQTMVQLLLEEGADSFTVDDVMGWNPLLYAAKSNAWDALEHLLCSKPAAEDTLTELQGHITNKQVEEHGHRGRDKATLIHVASAHGYVNLVRVLGRMFPESIWARDRSHMTPLHVASRWGEIGVARVLIELLEDNINARGALDESGSDPTGQESPDTTVAISDDDTSESNAHCDTYEASCDIYGPHPRSLREYTNTPNGDMFSALHLAAKHGHSELLRLLISKKGNIWAEDNEDRSPLQVACECGSEPAARVLIHSLGGNTKAMVQYVNNVSRNGRTALHDASKHGFLDVVKLLVSNGGDVTKMDTTDSTSLHYACWRCDEDLARALIGGLGDDGDSVANYINTVNAREDENEWQWSGEGESALQYASWKGHRSLVRYLVSRGGDVWADGKRGGTLLHDACKWGDVETARVLVDHLQDKDDLEVYVDTEDSNGRKARDLIEDLFSEFHTEDERIEVVEYLDELIEKCSELW